MYVCNRFTIEMYRFMHSLRNFWHVPLRMPSGDGMEIEFEDSKIEDDARMSPDVWKTVNCSTKG